MSVDRYGSSRHMVPGFSLNEAARIRERLLGARDTLECPRCSGALNVLEGRDPPHEAVCLVACGSCGTSLMIELASFAAG